MMPSDVCLSDVCRVHPVGGRRVRPAGWVARIRLIGPGSAVAQGCRCALPLQAWAGTYRGGRPPTVCYCCFRIALRVRCHNKLNRLSSLLLMAFAELAPIT